jgi:hypothetical protein
MNLQNEESTSCGKIRRILQLLMQTFGVLGIIGVFGAGYCDHQLRLAPLKENVREGALTLREYKGQVRFITITDDTICSVLTNMAFFGIGAACVCAFAFFFLVGGRKEL